jgi:hypothetical protein
VRATITPRARFAVAAAAAIAMDVLTRVGCRGQPTKYWSAILGSRVIGSPLMKNQGG